MTLPTVTSGTLWAHYDASELTGLSDGDALTTWPDLSGNSNDMAATSTGLKPVYDTDSDVPSGLPTVLVGQLREINDSWTGPAPATYFLLVKNPPDHGALHFIQGAFAPQMILWSTAGRWIFGTSTSGGQFIEFTDTDLPGEWCLWTFVWQNTGAILRANQSQRATGNITTVSATTGFEVGNANNNFAETFHAAEIVIYDGVLDSTDIDAVEDYLHAKWLEEAGITGTGASTLDDVTSEGEGTFTPPAITGTGSSTLADVTSDGDGTFTLPAITGTGSSTLEPVTSDGTGVYTPAGITGTGSSTLGDVTSAGSGLVINPITGTGASTLGNVTSVGVGAFFGAGQIDNVVCDLIGPIGTCDLLAPLVECDVT